jgi:2-oxoisovalerate dehydrogenase E2 component (dihydrolipoyl transacylase)
MPKFTYNLPDIGEGIAEAEIVAWHVKVGDIISEDQPLADMMTDKATVEMESPVSGVVTKVSGEAGDVIAIGAMLVEIEVAGEASAETAEAAPLATEPAVSIVEDENPHAPEPIFVAQVTPTSLATALVHGHGVASRPSARQGAWCRFD